MVARHALVTGATGGLGRSLVPALIRAGYKVRATGRNAELGAILEKDGAEFISADLRAPLPHDLLSGIDTIFHLAALSSPWGLRKEFETVNIDITNRLLEKARQKNTETFIFTSTPSVYTGSSDRLDLSEDDNLAAPFANHYALTKYIAENNVIAANSDSLQTAVLRPRAITGPNDTVLLPRLLRAANSGYMPLPNNGRAKIELTDIRDVVSALVKADQTRDKANGHVFNISSAQPRPLRDLLKLIFSSLDKNVRFISQPGGVFIGTAGILEILSSIIPGRPEPLATRYSMKALAYSQTFDISKARAFLNWSPRFTPEETIEFALAGISREN